MPSCHINQFNITVGDDFHAYSETVYSSTYPCITFRCQRICHPGAESGSRRLDGDGITDACQFATCCKGRSEMETSRATPIWVFSLNTQIHFFFSFIIFKSKKGLDLSVRELMSSLLSLLCFFHDVQEVLNIQFTHANACFTPSVCTWESERKEGSSVYSAPMCCL